jgi:hypothetical protein
MAIDPSAEQAQQTGAQGGDGDDDEKWREERIAALQY